MFELFDTTTLWAFALATLAVYIAPGPDMAFIASNAFRGGKKAASVAAAGCVTGVWIQALATAFGVTAVFVASPFAFEVVRWAGITYLIYLGLRLLITSETAATQSNAPIASAQRIWLQGIAINLLNPKISVFFISFLPQFVDASRGSVFLQLLTLAVVFSLGAIAWTQLLAVGFARLGIKAGDQFTSQCLATADHRQRLSHLRRTSRRRRTATACCVDAAKFR